METVHQSVMMRGRDQDLRPCALGSMSDRDEEGDRVTYEVVRKMATLQSCSCRTDDCLESDNAE